MQTLLFVDSNASGMYFYQKGIQMDYELKKQYYNVYKNIHRLQEQMERDIGDISPSECEEIRMEIIQNYLVVGEREPAIVMLNDYIEQWVTPRNLFRSSVPVRAYVLLISLYLMTGRKREAEEFLDRFKAYIKYSFTDAEPYIAVMAYTEILEAMLNRDVVDGKSFLQKIESMESYYEKNKNALPVDFAVSIYTFFSTYYFRMKEINTALKYWKKAYALSELAGLRFRTCELYKQLSTCYEGMGMYKEALESYKTFCQDRNDIWNAKEYAYSDFLIAEYGIKSASDIEKELLEKNSSLKEKSYKDTLTGLYNRRFLSKSLEEVFKKESTVLVHAIMFDIDFFKDYNDNYGHLKGDRILEKIGEMLSAIKSETVIPVRYGGEEFLMIICGRSITETEIVANTVLQDLRNRHYSHEYSNVAKYVTMSAGVAELECRSMDDVYILCDMADKALYKAKSIGRNTCVRYEKQ